MAQVADAVQVRSLAQKLPPATAKAKEKKKKKALFYGTSICYAFVYLF